MPDRTRTTLNLRKDLIDKARRFSGIKRKTDLVHAGLQALIEREAIRKLASMGGAFPDAKAPPRRRWRKSA
jgi:hypothetical protein